MKLTSDQNFPGIKKGILFHVLFWAGLILIEVTLAELLAKRNGTFWDYAFHYLLYISLFYFHSHVALKRFATGFLINVALAMSALVATHLLNMVIFLCLQGLHVDTWVSNPLSLTFFLASTYRYLFILLLSTAYWHMMKKIQKERENHQQRKLILEKELENEVLRAEQMQSELNRIKASINPHFLFNTFNVLYYLMRKDHPQVASHLLTLSEMMQYNLSPVSKDSTALLKDEIRHFKNYLALRRLYQNDAVKVSIKIDSEDMQVKIVPLLINTLTENVFQHGVTNDRQHPARISIRLSGRKFRIRISNKIKQPVQHGSQLGLSSTLERLKIFHRERFYYHSHTYRQVFFQRIYIHL